MSPFAAWLALLALPGALAGSWVMTFEDNFDGDSLNTSSWTALQAPPTNQYPGHDALFIPEAVAVANGYLVITTWLNQSVPGFNMSSGWVSTEGKVTQARGRFEASMKMPDRYSIGSWPAWWLLPQNSCWPVGGEVDIIEWYGGDTGHYQHSTPGEPSAMSSTYHYGYSCLADASHYTNDSRWYPNTTDFNAPIIDFSADFHVFGVEINDTALRFYVDNTTSFVRTLSPLCVTEPGFVWGETAYIPWQPMYGIINVAVVQNTNTTWWKTNNSTLLVDWVRWYEYQP